MRRRRCWLVHGFNVHDEGAATVDRLAPYVEGEGWVAQQFDYGWRGLFGVAFGNAGLARRLAALSDLGEAAIGHSNGCAVLHRASHLGAHFRRLVYINPALDCDAAPGPRVQRLDVFHAPDDTATWAASLVPWSLWGPMGRDGYRGPDPRVHSHNLADYLTGRMGHSGAFRRIESFGPLVAYMLGPPR